MTTPRALSLAGAPSWSQADNMKDQQALELRLPRDDVTLTND